MGGWDWSLITEGGGGGGLQHGRGGGMFHPYEKGGGEKVVAMLMGGGGGETSFGLVFMRWFEVLAILRGRHKRFPLFKRGGGAKRFRTRNFAVINDQSLRLANLNFLT